MPPLNRVSPVVTQLYGIGLPTKRRAVAVSQGQAAAVRFQFFDGIGNPADLSMAYSPQGPQTAPTVVCRLREAAGPSSPVYEVDCDVIDETTGVVEFYLPSAVYNNAGVYQAEFAAFDPETNEVSFTNRCYVWVDRGLFGNARYPNSGPPSFDEVRLYIRDNAPEENLLLDDFEFDLAEICMAAELAIRYWNEAQPPVDVFFDTMTFAARDKWLTYIAGHLFITAAHRFRRNQLAYQAGGIAVDDQNKFQLYAQTGMALQQDYKEWVKLKKTQINCGMAITSQGSPYGATLYGIINTGI